MAGSGRIGLTGSMEISLMFISGEKSNLVGENGKSLGVRLRPGALVYPLYVLIPVWRMDTDVSICSDEGQAALSTGAMKFLG